MLSAPMFLELAAAGANLMTAQVAAHAREMALRLLIGAGRSRLIQLVLMESVVLAFIA